MVNVTQFPILDKAPKGRGVGPDSYKKKLVNKNFGKILLEMQASTSVCSSYEPEQTIDHNKKNFDFKTRSNNKTNIYSNRKAEPYINKEQKLTKTPKKISYENLDNLSCMAESQYIKLDSTDETEPSKPEMFLDGVLLEGEIEILDEIKEYQGVIISEDISFTDTLNSKQWNIPMDNDKGAQSEHVVSINSSTNPVTSESNSNVLRLPPEETDITFFQEEASYSTERRVRFPDHDVGLYIEKHSGNQLIETIAVKEQEKFMLEVRAPETTALAPKMVIELMNSGTPNKLIFTELDEAESATQESGSNMTSLKESEQDFPMDIKLEHTGISEQKNEEEGSKFQGETFQDGMEQAFNMGLSGINEKGITLDFPKTLYKETSIEPYETIRQFAERAVMLLGENRSEMEIQLKPEYLGKILLKVVVENGVLSGNIYTDTQQAKELLLNNLQDLKDSLQAQGYEFSQLDVNVGNHQDEQRFQEFIQPTPRVNKTNLLIDPLENAMDQVAAGKTITPIMNTSHIDYWA